MAVTRVEDRKPYTEAMHMADSLVSAAVGGTFWAVAAGFTARASHGLQREGGDRLVPRMGVLGAFVFAAQMLNFAIPGTGSSGHLAGGLLLAVLLGPHAAVLVMGSVLLVQALLFADGGLLAFGCNLFNLGVLPAWVAYPLVYRPLARRGWRAAAAVLGCQAALLLGALAVALETLASRLAGLPPRAFLTTMLVIHLPIALVEGIVTAGLVAFLVRARAGGMTDRPPSLGQRALGGLLGLALLGGGVLSWFASDRPDGLEWSLARSEAQITEPAGRWHRWLAALQARTSPLPDYAFRDAGGPARAGTSLSGLVGAAATLVLVGAAGWALRRRPGGA